MGAFDGFFFYALFVAPVVTAVQRKLPGGGKGPRGTLVEGRFVSILCLHFFDSTRTLQSKLC